MLGANKSITGLMDKHLRPDYRDTHDPRESLLFPPPPPPLPQQSGPDPAIFHAHHEYFPDPRGPPRDMRADPRGGPNFDPRLDSRAGHRGDFRDDTRRDHVGEPRDIQGDPRGDLRDPRGDQRKMVYQDRRGGYEPRPRGEWDRAYKPKGEGGRDSWRGCDHPQRDNRYQDSFRGPRDSHYPVGNRSDVRGGRRGQYPDQGRSGGGGRGREEEHGWAYPLREGPPRGGSFGRDRYRSEGDRSKRDSDPPGHDRYKHDRHSGSGKREGEHGEERQEQPTKRKREEGEGPSSKKKEGEARRTSSKDRTGSAKEPDDKVKPKPEKPLKMEEISSDDSIGSQHAARKEPSVKGETRVTELKEEANPTRSSSRDRSRSSRESSALKEGGREERTRRSLSRGSSAQRSRSKQRDVDRAEENIKMEAIVEVKTNERIDSAVKQESEVKMEKTEAAPEMKTKEGERRTIKKEEKDEEEEEEGKQDLSDISDDDFVVEDEDGLQEDKPANPRKMLGRSKTANGIDSSVMDHKLCKNNNANSPNLLSAILDEIKALRNDTTALEEHVKSVVDSQAKVSEQLAELIQGRKSVHTDTQSHVSEGARPKSHWPGCARPVVTSTGVYNPRDLGSIQHGATRGTTSTVQSFKRDLQPLLSNWTDSVQVTYQCSTSHQVSLGQNSIACGQPKGCTAPTYVHSGLISSVTQVAESVPGVSQVCASPATQLNPSIHQDQQILRTVHSMLDTVPSSEYATVKLQYEIATKSQIITRKFAVDNGYIHSSPSIRAASDTRLQLPATPTTQGALANARDFPNIHRSLSQKNLTDNDLYGIVERMGDGWQKVGIKCLGFTIDELSKIDADEPKFELKIFKMFSKWNRRHGKNGGGTVQKCLDALHKSDDLDPALYVFLEELLL
ncbi:uncharacterized protein [Apostichopus japonicus]|uniref:uncharacterized protein isoform X2 n=1 Tax=Stichopus japonicus TaxID=307972 RepID=UPI003AB619FF